MQSFDQYKGVLPYASEIFGIYQPLLGWKSRLTLQRFEKARAVLQERVAARVLASARSPVRLSFREHSHDRIARLEGGNVDVERFQPVELNRSIAPMVASTIDSAVARLIAAELPPEPPDEWRSIVNRDRILHLMERVRSALSDPEKLRQDELLSAYVADFQEQLSGERVGQVVEALFDVEAKVAGYLIHLGATEPHALEPLFYSKPKSHVLAEAKRQDPLLSFGQDSYDAVLSPVGIIHLYRQYFFEFDSFLGPAVGHVWLSPGGTVELIEVSTRRTLTERAHEQAVETIVKSETETTTRDDIADAIKDENRSSVKFGFTATASYSAAVWSASASSDLSIENSKQTARETTHQQMREQSEKLSSEIKRNFKTTFKTSTEVTDTSSKRYVISNDTKRLVNYELRRKMRKVGVQVQDIGVALCWHTFVDDAGRELGISKLIHIGKPPELGDLPQPDAPVVPTAQPQELSITIPFVGIDTDDTDNEYTDGAETVDSGWLDDVEHIEPDFPQSVLFSTPGYTLVKVDLEPQGFDARLSVRDLVAAPGASAATFTIHLDYVNWGGKNQIPLKVTLHWAPGDAIRAAIADEYTKRLSEYSAEKARRFKEAFYEAARERIKLASNVLPRPAEDLREEERTIVYRALISQLMSVGTAESKHVTSELVRSIFDVDKMLYFVAPEWWTPRLHRSAQYLGEPPDTGGGGRGPRGDLGAAADLSNSMVAHRFTRKVPGGFAGKSGSSAGATPIPAEYTADWGGARELGRDNYYITEDSREARLGSSLGWLLQLDGDNLRNAFLNAPWVKAVIPIRIGKEREALAWLSQAHVEGAEGLDASYVPPENSPATGTPPATVRDALNELIEKIRDFDTNSRTPIKGDTDPDSLKSHFEGSLPTEAVFENGFYPLKGGVRFDGNATEQSIISQWMEILPTDQVAALAVDYDPKTLQVREPPEDPPPPP